MSIVVVVGFSLERATFLVSSSRLLQKIMGFVYVFVDVFPSVTTNPGNRREVRVRDRKSLKSLKISLRRGRPTNNFCLLLLFFMFFFFVFFTFFYVFHVFFFFVSFFLIVFLFFQFFYSFDFVDFVFHFFMFFFFLLFFCGRAVKEKTNISHCKNDEFPL